MTPRSSDDIRAAFIEFWQSKGSHLQPSSSLIPHNDPTVLLTTAGMQQFVPFFLGKERSPYPRYVSVQKCFRTSDIDEVGDRSHLTFFEMLGNFSVGDYFKAEVIPWALDFATTAMGLDQDRLWITIHTTDDEANAIWLEAGIPQERIKRFGDEDNWWGPPGKSGPCGPNSELYYAQTGVRVRLPRRSARAATAGASSSGTWSSCNTTRTRTGIARLLPQPNVDTGMGMERATVVTQGLESIYDTDLFRPVIHAAEGIAGVTYGNKAETDYALRVLADHAPGDDLPGPRRRGPGPGRTRLRAAPDRPSRDPLRPPTWASSVRSWVSWSTPWSSVCATTTRTFSARRVASRKCWPRRKSCSVARCRRVRFKWNA